MLDKEGVARDINGYPKAPPSIRIWGGSMHKIVISRLYFHG